MSDVPEPMGDVDDESICPASPQFPAVHDGHDPDGVDRKPPSNVEIDAEEEAQQDDPETPVLRAALAGANDIGLAEEPCEMQEQAADVTRASDGYAPDGCAAMDIDGAGHPAGQPPTEYSKDEAENPPQLDVTAQETLAASMQEPEVAPATEVTSAAPVELAALSSTPEPEPEADDGYASDASSAARAWAAALASPHGPAIIAAAQPSPKVEKPPEAPGSPPPSSPELDSSDEESSPSSISAADGEPAGPEGGPSE